MCGDKEGPKGLIQFMDDENDLSVCVDCISYCIDFVKVTIILKCKKCGKKVSVLSNALSERNHPWCCKKKMSNWQEDET